MYQCPKRAKYYFHPQVGDINEMMKAVYQCPKRAKYYFHLSWGFLMISVCLYQCPKRAKYYFHRFQEEEK